MEKGCRYGTHRVISPIGSMPQSADQIDNHMVIKSNEMRAKVKTLNIDSASFAQIKAAANSDIETMKDMILSIVSSRGKMHNPVTGSGGMFLGTVIEIGPDFHADVKVGDEIASLVSLSLTPLKIDRIISIHPNKDQVDIEGEAILFESGIFAKIPHDLPSHLVLSALDVAGAPAQVAKLVQAGDTVLILGASGKSGLLCAYQARKNTGVGGRIIGVIYDAEQYDDLYRLSVCDDIVIADARDAIAIYHQVFDLTQGALADVTINVVNVRNTELSSILPTRPGGIVYFFSMATSFTKAALGAEGIASEATMIIGNGYTKGHAELTLNLFRESQKLYDIFLRRYGGDERLDHHE